MYNRDNIESEETVKIYSAKEAAEYLDTTSAMVRYYTRRGILKGQYKGNVWVYIKEDLDRFAKNVKRTK
jgi:DNA-binding transcriptional MerR regulator